MQDTAGLVFHTQAGMASVWKRILYTQVMFRVDSLLSLATVLAWAR